MTKAEQGLFYRSGTGQVLRVHPQANLCSLHGCVIHAPTPHRMRDWPTHWRGDVKIMERLCMHGIGHPDPDDNSHTRRTMGAIAANAAMVHSCDGCCPNLYKNSYTQLNSGSTPPSEEHRNKFSVKSAFDEPLLPFMKSNLGHLYQQPIKPEPAIKEYVIKVACDNCGRQVKGVSIPYGQSVPEFCLSRKCETCGLKGFFFRSEGR